MQNSTYSTVTYKLSGFVVSVILSFVIVLDTLKYLWKCVTNAYMNSDVSVIWESNLLMFSQFLLRCQKSLLLSNRTSPHHFNCCLSVIIHALCHCNSSFEKSGGGEVLNPSQGGCLASGLRKLSEGSGVLYRTWCCLRWSTVGLAMPLWPVYGMCIFFFSSFLVSATHFSDPRG